MKELVVNWLSYYGLAESEKESQYKKKKRIQTFTIICRQPILNTDAKER